MENFSIEQYRFLEDIACQIHLTFIKGTDLSECTQKISDLVKKLSEHFTVEQIPDAFGTLITYCLIKYGLGVLDSLSFATSSTATEVWNDNAVNPNKCNSPYQLCFEV